MTVFHPISPQAPPTQATSATFFGPTLNSPSDAGGLRGRPQPHGFSTPIIALLAAGGGPRPKPSLPIFDDPFAEETGMSTKESESPIFGGKERLSPRPASNNGFGTWTQYTQAHPPLAFPSKVASNEDLSEQGYSAIPYLHNQNTTSHEPHPPPGPGQSVEYRTEANSQTGMPMHQRRLSQITARFSMASVSMYPGSPPIPEGNREGNTPFTADGHPVIKRNKSRASLHAVTRHSFQEYGQGLAYDGADIFSPDLAVIPVIASAPSVPARGGRTRIKSSYYTAPRASALPTSLSSGVVDATQDIPHQQPLAIKRSDSRKDRDTRALTYALGLSSPPADYAALSPQPTLYPDDSLSVIATRRQNRCSHKKAVESGCNSGEQKDSPALPLYMDPNAALGNLMLMDYSVTSKSLAADGGRTAQESATWMSGPIESTSKKSFQSRSDDRPPRVPSPPPLPSLAQMGLEHDNPEAYANYRSPTYSIYGLYETDRKSRLVPPPSTFNSHQGLLISGFPFIRYFWSEVMSQKTDNVILPIQLNLNLTQPDGDGCNDMTVAFDMMPMEIRPVFHLFLEYLSNTFPSPSRAYSAATAVLLNEILKGTISLIVAFARVESAPLPPYLEAQPGPPSGWNPRHIQSRLLEAIYPCYSICIQFGGCYLPGQLQMKILTTAGFSVLLLRKRLCSSQWVALLFLAIGVGVVQIQAGSAKAAMSNLSPPSADIHTMSATRGFMAVAAACFTSGLAGVYFEMVLKNSQTDLWVRNVQLSLFSLLPALAPVIFSHATRTDGPSGWFQALFHNFGAWAWATVSVQVLGGLVTAMVIKYSDNILKGFATSLSIVISFLASIALFDFKMNFTFILGS
ncbi:nucleotide-sugar transporter-domain-containing protein [Infundibulicybe gibba]|nr:nucleotide-sugar transporter-domain-containing protein [Infundibulicybe gibba]